MMTSWDNLMLYTVSLEDRAWTGYTPQVVPASPMDIVAASAVIINSLEEE
jgi:hypothetical protein